jgi:hypothetical protein
VNIAFKDLHAAINGTPIPDGSRGIIKNILNDGFDKATPNGKGRKLISKKSKAIL